MVMSRRLHGVAVCLISSALCLVALAGCGGAAGHLAVRRRREDPHDHAVAPAPEVQPVSAPTGGHSIPEALVWRGSRELSIDHGYPLRCGMYPGVGYAATLDLQLPGRTSTLNIQLPTYNGPGLYRIAGRNGSEGAQLTLSGASAAESGTLAVEAGGLSGTMNVKFGPIRGSHPARVDSLIGTWSCAVRGGGEGAPGTPPSSNANEGLTVSGALEGHLTRAAIPSFQLLAGAPNCSVYQVEGASRFNLAMVVSLQAQPYILDVQLQQYQGAGMYYPSFTALSLPIETSWATAELVPYGQQPALDQIPSAIWAGVGGDFHLDPGLSAGLMSIRFMNRSGNSFIVTGTWNC